MNIWKLPTDNLYKFIALFGIFIVSFSTIIIEWRIYKQWEIDSEIRVGKEILYQMIESNIYSVTEDKKELYKDMYNLRLKSELADNYLTWTKEILKYYFLYNTIWWIMIIWGFTFWYLKLQRYQDKILYNKIKN